MIQADVARRIQRVAQEIVEAETWIEVHKDDPFFDGDEFIYIDVERGEAKQCDICTRLVNLLDERLPGRATTNAPARHQHLTQVALTAHMECLRFASNIRH